jgi:DNA invertase Pin-like site-specific DNA recombinase
MKAQLRCGIYDRVSDDQDGDSRSVEQQGKENQAAADEHGWRVVARYADPGRSASRFAKHGRDDWPKLMADLKARRLDVIVLWESSRGDRKLTEWSAFLDLCREIGVLIHVTIHRHTYDLSIARDWRTLAEEGVSNAYSSEETSLRIRRDMADAAEQGKPHGRLAYGYTRRYEYVPGKRKPVGHQEPHPEQAPIVREIITRIAQGDALSALVRDLTARGVPTPTGSDRWARSTVQRIVLSGVCYIGKRRHNGGPLLDGNWPAIVDEDTYWRAVSVLSDPARKKQADKRGGIRPGAAKWLCSYIGTCAKCGAGLAVQHRIVGGEKIPQYRCSSSRGGCAVIPVEFMDWVVSEAIISFCARADTYAGIMAGDDRDTTAARDEAASERARLADFEQQAIAGKISADSFARIASGIEAHIAELEARAQDSVPPALRGMLEHGSRKDHIRAVWDDMPLTARRRVVQALFAEPGYLRLRPSGPAGRAHGDAVLDPARIEIQLPLGVAPWPTPRVETAS